MTFDAGPESAGMGRIFLRGIVAPGGISIAVAVASQEHRESQDAYTTFAATAPDVWTSQYVPRTSLKRPRGDGMANDRLRTAMIAAGLTADALAAKVHVDPKTVERWISNERRRPHRTTRQQVADVLRTRAVDLWPTPTGEPSTHDHDSELVHLYPARSSMSGPTWEQLIDSVQEHMDVLVFSGVFLVEQYNLIPIIQHKAAQGVRFRLLVGDETAQAVIQRAIDEGTSGGLEGRVQLMRRYLTEVSRLAGVEVRTHGTILYNSLYRFDDDLLVNGHAHGALAGQNPVLHLKRLPTGKMWQHYMNSFERVWDQAIPESTR